MSSEAGEGASLEAAKAGTSAFEGGPIVGRGQLTEEDFRAVWAVLPRNRQALVKLVFSLLAIPLFWLMVAVLDSRGWSGLMSLPLVVGSFFVGAVSAFGIWRRRLLWAQTAAKQMRNAEGVEFRFDAVGVSLAVPGLPSQHEWSSLHRCVETTQVIAIFTAPTMVMVVPKRAFAAHELTRVRALLLKHVPKPELPAMEWRPLWRKALLGFLLLGAFLMLLRVLNQR